jgi:hypothetical protein
MYTVRPASIKSVLSVLSLNVEVADVSDASKALEKDPRILDGISIRLLYLGTPVLKVKTATRSFFSSSDAG